MIYSVLASQLLLWLIDGLPALLSFLSMASHVIYLQNLRRFPIVKLTDPIFIASCGMSLLLYLSVFCLEAPPLQASFSEDIHRVSDDPSHVPPTIHTANKSSIVLVLVNHYFWFRHFSTPPSYSPSSSKYPYERYYGESPYDLAPTFTEIASFFGLCVWLVPFSLFVSLSASENVLPSMGSEYATGQRTGYSSVGKEPAVNGSSAPSRGRQGMAKAVVDSIRGWLAETSELMGFSKSDRIRHAF